MGAATRFLVRALTWPLLPAMVAAMPGDRIGLGDVPYAVAMLACWLVGVVLTWRAVHQPAGWAFLGLGTAIAWSGFTEELALRAGDRLLATFADSSWVWWFVFAALALQLTLPVRVRPRRLPPVTAALGVAAQLLMLLRTRPLEPPFAGLHSPWAVPRLGGVVDALSYAVVLALGVCLLASVLALVRAWRRAQDDERRQLLWLVAGAVLLAPAAVAGFALSHLGHDDLAGWPLVAAFVALAAGAALSVLRYRLYDVERVVSESVAYALASGAVIVAFVLVVVVISRTTPLGESSQLSTVAATLAGVAVARQSYVWARRAIGRRLDRVRFNAVDAVRRGLHTAPVDLDALVAHALDDPGARILYPTARGWVTEHGQVVTPGAHTVDVRGAKVEFDPRRVDRDVVLSVAVEAAAEIDNVALRAELARQLAMVTESRARLATAHQDERRRLERDLHDGAQQRILAIALQLQSARLNGAADVLRAEVDRAVVDLGRTLHELRDLASGMQPAALASGGLLAAVADVAERIPVPVTYEVPDRRFGAAAEGTAWFVVAEAVANAVKHAAAEGIRIEVEHGAGGLTVTVSDTGAGGADPDGHGLRGLHDRVAAAGGSLTVVDLEPSGTAVRAVLPCE
jgi:signal transduction histidine kinase